MKDVLEQINNLIREQYISAEKGEQLAHWLETHQQQGILDDLTDPVEFAHAVTELLAPYDNHLLLRYDPSPGDPMARHQMRARRSNYGFYAVQRLAGNIGYIDLHELPPVSVAGAMAHGAMALVSSTYAIIIDLRSNSGGTPEMVQLIASYFFDEKPRSLSGVYWRATDQTIPQATLSHLPNQRMPHVPLYILTSGMTFSGAEALAYDLQALERATIVGETTQGGAHPSAHYKVGEHFEIRIPIGRAINPLTNSNWEGIGVQPDVDVHASEALLTAHLLALEELEESYPAFIRWERENLRATLDPYQPELIERHVGQFGDHQLLILNGNLIHRAEIDTTLVPLARNLFMLNDETRLKVEKTALTILKRDGGQARFERTT